MCDMTHAYVWHDTFICVTWFIHTCDMTHSYMWHDSFTCVKWLIYMSSTRSDVLHDAFTRVTCHIHTFDMTHPHTQPLLIYLAQSAQYLSNVCVTWLVQRVQNADNTSENTFQYIYIYISSDVSFNTSKELRMSIDEYTAHTHSEYISYTHEEKEYMYSLICRSIRHSMFEDVIDTSENMFQYIYIYVYILWRVVEYS